MIMGKRLIGTFTVIGLIAILMMPFEGADKAALAAEAKNLNAGVTWVVDKTTSLSALTIASGASIKAPGGSSVTLTVDGVETPIEPGTYKGNVVLTLTKEIPVKYQSRTYNVRMAIDIEDGKYVPEKSVAAAVVGGTVTDSDATDIKITSVGPDFNGIMVKGKSRYTITNPVIKLTGMGGSDFAGVGAAIVTEGTSEVTINKATIINHGVIRSAAVVADNSIMHMNDSKIETYSGTLPADVKEPWNGNNPYGMIAVPWMLGLTGNNRATNVTGSGTAYYTNTHIKAQAWGALSTDACRDVKLYVKDSHIETVESGYGAYADGAYDSFSNTRFDVHDYALIMTGGTGIFTDGSVVNSGRFGVMFHGSAKLTIDKACVFNTKEAAIQVKSARPTIVVDNATLNSGNGLILQVISNDDPNMKGGMMGGAPGGVAPGGAGGPGSAPGEKSGDKAAGGMPGGSGGTSGGDRGGSMPGGDDRGGSMPGGEGRSGGMPGGGSTEVSATFKNMNLKGDIVTSMTAESDVVITFEKANITGAITTSTATPIGTPSYEKYFLIGEVKHTYCETNDKYGIKVSLKGDSAWVVDKTSYLTGLTIADGGSVKAPAGRKLSMTVNGAGTDIKVGAYSGKIILKVE
jgi:hypothetical protein